jgi:DNA-binding CsgD family transcriptional regulator/PAS domain-containing protein
MIERGEFSDTVELIYEAGLDFHRWPAVLERLAEALGASASSLVRHDLATSEGAMILIRSDPKFAQLYAEHYAKLNIHAQRAGYRPAGTCLTDRMVLPKEEVCNSEFYAGFMQPQDIHSLLSVFLLWEGDRATRITFGRSHRAGEWEQAEIERLRLFAPHLHRAALVGRQLEYCRFSGAEGAIAALDLLTRGVIVVDAESRPVFVNRAGERMLAAADGLATHAGVLATGSRSQTASLRRLIAAALGEAKDTAGGTLSIARRSARRPYSLLVAPLHMGAGWFLPRRSRAIVIVWDPEQVTSAPKAHLRHLYGLTAAEVALTMEITRGGGLKVAADAMGITPATARTHLQRVFQKTQTHRQAELTRLVTEMQAGLVPTFLGT